MADFVQWLGLIDASLRLATPLLFAALAGMLSERSGIIDIGLEGKMLVSAFAAAAWVAISGSVWQAVAMAMLAAMALSLLHAFACITHRGDQVISGVAINMLALAGTAILGQYLFKLGGMTPVLSDSHRLGNVDWLPLIERDNSALSLVYWELISGQNILVYIAFLMVLVLSGFFKFSPLGKRLVAAGDNPLALSRAGGSVKLTRYGAVLAGGALCGLAGAYLSIGHGAGFINNMTVGKGFIALAALIFGQWRPVGVLCSCLLFGFLEALSIRMQGLELFDTGYVVPVQLIEMVPYILTVTVLAGFVSKPVIPKALGRKD
jgi:simple sugar transport system permease protein